MNAPEEHDQAVDPTALVRRVAELEALVASLLERLPPAEPVPAARTLSRRRLISAVPAAVAAGLVGTVAQAAPAAAADGGTLRIGQPNYATSTTSLDKDGGGVALAVNAGLQAGLVQARGLLVSEYEGPDQTSENHAVVQVFPEVSAGIGGAGSGRAIYGFALSTTAITGDARAGSGYDPGTDTGSTTPGNGVEGRTDSGAGVLGNATADGVGVAAVSVDGHALTARLAKTSTSQDAVVVSTEGTGRGLLATADNPANGAGTITGITKGTGAALWGTQANPTATAAAVVGWAGAKGKGGRFKGGAAAINLSPVSAPTHPASGSAGDLFVDASARLWYCSGGASWKQLA